MQGNAKRREHTGQTHKGASFVGDNTDRDENHIKRVHSDRQMYIGWNEANLAAYSLHLSYSLLTQSDNVLLFKLCQCKCSPTGAHVSSTNHPLATNHMQTDSHNFLVPLFDNSDQSREENKIT